MNINRKAILFVIIFGFMFGLLACQSKNTQNTGTPVIPASLPTSTVEYTQTPLPTAAPDLASTPGADESRSSIVKALSALYDQPNRMEVTTVISGGQTSKNTIEFIPPDKKRIVDEAQAVEYIVIGEKVYAKTSGQWNETQIPASAFLGDGKVNADTIGSTISDAQWVRKDSLNGTAMNVYRYSSTTVTSGIELRSQTELWIGEQDGLPYQMIIEGDVLSASTDPATGENKLQAVKALSTTLNRFDQTISIEPPVQ